MVESSEKRPYEGYLSKGGKNLLIQYPKRYFRILGGALFWYKSKDDTAPLGDILLSDVTEILVKLKNKEGVPFDIVTGKRTLNLIAASPAVLDYWLSAFGSHVKITREAETSADQELKRGSSLLGLKQQTRNSGDAALPVGLHKNRDAKPTTPQKTTEKPDASGAATTDSKPAQHQFVKHTPSAETQAGTSKNLINQNNTSAPPGSDARTRSNSSSSLQHSASGPIQLNSPTDHSKDTATNNHTTQSPNPKPPRRNTRSLDSELQPTIASTKSPKPLPTVPRPLPVPRGKGDTTEVPTQQAQAPPQPVESTEQTDVPADEGEEEHTGYSTVCYAKVHSKFSGEGEVGTVLELTPGMVIGIVEQGEDGWWLGYPLQTMDLLGYFPGSYVDILSAEEAATITQKKDQKKKSSTLFFSVSEGASEKPATFDPQKRANTAKEILITEQSYVKFIDVLIKHYEQPFTQWISQGNVTTSVTRNDIKGIFLNVSQIYPLNQEMLKRLEATLASSKPNIGDVFLQMAPFLKIYNEFGNRYQSAIDTLNKIRLDSAFMQLEGECHNKAGRQNSLENLLIMPVQRIPRYIMLLEELLKNTPPDQSDRSPLEQAIAQVKQVAHSFNESVKKFSNTQRLLSITKGVEQILAPHRVLIQENSVQIEKRSLNGASVIQRGTYQLLLFNDILVFAQKGEVTVTYPLDLVWVDTSGNLVGTTPLELGLVVPSASYTIKLINNNSVPAKQDLMKCITTAITEFQKKNPPAEPPPFSTTTSTVSKTSSLLPVVRFGKFALGTDVDYDGWWNWGKFHLSGSYEWHGNSYIGEWDNGQKSGMGTCHFNSGEVYSGSWSGDKPNGKGQLIFLDGDVYVGEWKDGKMSGDGELVYINGNCYKGAWKDGLPHGHGVFTSKQTEKDGNWICGKLSGYGTERHSKGWLYTGYWNNDKREGRGIMHCTDNTTYEGSWKDGHRHGQGKLIERATNSQRATNTDTNSGTEGTIIYDGEWLNDKMEGKGTMYYTNGAVYIGQWRDGKRNGNGVYSITMPDGKYEKYEGEWSSDRKQGRGVMTTLGGKYEGTFRDDRYHGLGVLTLANGTMLDGRWLHGNLEGRCIITKQDINGKTVTVMIAKDKEGIAAFGDNTEIIRLPTLPLLD